MEDFITITQMKAKNRILLFTLLLAVCSSFTFPFSARLVDSAQTPNSYDRATSVKYAAISSITHCPKSCIQIWSCKTILSYPKLVSVTYLENSITKASGFIGFEISTGTMIISWRGSSNAQNWIEDFNFETTPYLACANCHIHAGFYTDYKSNQKVLVTAADAIIKNYKVSKIVCTGQSLGGALSSVNGIEFVHRYPNIPIEVHNFGSPRIGNNKLADFLKLKIPSMYRVVHNKDLVPHLPPQALEYRHPPYEVFFNEDMSSYKVCNASGEDASCSNQFAPKYDTNDHDFYFMPIGSPKC